MNILRKVRNYFGYDASGSLAIKGLLYPRRLTNVLKYFYFKNRYPLKLPYLPVSLMVEVSTVCNLSCPGCERELYKQDRAQGGLPKENVRLSNLEKLSPILPYVYSVYFVSGMGEPFLNKEFWSIHKFFKNFGIKTSYFSNGSLITEADIEKTFEERVNSVVLSIDTTREQKYQIIKGGGEFSKAIFSLKLFDTFRKKNNVNAFKIGLNFIFRSDNYDDILEYLDFAKENNVDYINCTSFITHIPEMADVSFFNIDLKEKKELFDKVTQKARRLKIDIRLPALSPTKKRPCNCLWHSACIFYNGDVCACPFFRSEREFYYHIDKDSNIIFEKRIYNDTVLGNYLTQDFDEIWNGPKVHALREAELKGDINFNPCGSCYYKYDLH
jgi:MoaA/NifB/PqqE/SkfB family radical SAM enzyme